MIKLYSIGFAKQTFYSSKNSPSFQIKTPIKKVLIRPTFYALLLITLVLILYVPL